MRGQLLLTLALATGLVQSSPLGADNTITATIVSTVYTGTASTSVVFKSGNPPTNTTAAAATYAAKRDLQDRDLTSTVYQTTTLPASTVTSTVYPCATPVTSLTPTLPYGSAHMANNASLPDVDGNALYGLETTQGGTLQGCCNACFFELENCLQAWWYSYEGCVVMSADPSKFTGTGAATSTCPQGKITGLEYERDTNVAFRSDGDFAGPCGETYLDE